ncbi:retrotransposon protein, putative, ty1-copia subclass [Tanacetum coccineum]
MGYSFYYPPENKVLDAWNVEFLENILITQEASESLEDLEIIQEEDTYPSIDTSLNHEDDDQEINEPQSDINPVHRSTKTAIPQILNAINMEIQSMKDNEVWDLVELPLNGKTIGSNWLFKKKTDMDGALHTYKAHIRPIRILIAIAVFYDYDIWQMDVKTAFLNRYLSEEVYMEQPEASRSNITFLILYVDDILIMGNNIPMLQDVKSYLRRCFAMKDLGEAASILGIKIYRDRSWRLIGLCQSAYIEKILKRYQMENSKRGSIPMQDKLRLSKSQGSSTPAELKRMQNVPYASVVGSIMYAVRCTHFDVALAQNITIRFQQNPRGDIKRELKVSCYTDAGYLTDANDLKSQTGYVFILNGGVVDWKSAKKSIFATSSVEAEYIAAFVASKESIWVRKFIFGLSVVPIIEEPLSMYCDNTRAITIANESGITKGARHIHAKVYYLCEVIKYGDVKLEKVHTDDNLVDPFTKALAFLKHSEHTNNIGMLPASSLM